MSINLRSLHGSKSTAEDLAAINLAIIRSQAVDSVLSYVSLLGGGGINSKGAEEPDAYETAGSNSEQSFAALESPLASSCSASFPPHIYGANIEQVTAALMSYPENIVPPIEDLSSCTNFGGSNCASPSITHQVKGLNRVLIANTPVPWRTSFYQGTTVQSCRPAVRRKLVPLLISPEDAVSSRDSSLVIAMQLRVDCSSSLPVTSPVPSLQKMPMVLDDFTLTHLLGRGGQGKVYLARYNRMQPSRLVAIKVIRKSKLMLEARINMALQEQRVLKNLRDSPFVISLLASFHDTAYFYLVTDYHPGGDLQKVLSMAKTFTTKQARFYTAEMVLGLDFLHKNNILHRDLKLSNVMLKSDGHIVIVDFGLVKVFGDTSESEKECPGEIEERNRDPRATSRCGTVCYMAPEVLNREEYDFKADWWSLGICVYAMLQGCVPWDNADLKQIIHSIFKDPIPYSSATIMDNNAQLLVQKLLDKDSRSRLSAPMIFTHSFFDSINWDDLRLLKVDPPFIPVDDGEILAVNTLPFRNGFFPGFPNSMYEDRHSQYYYVSPELAGPGNVLQTPSYTLLPQPPRLSPSSSKDCTKSWTMSCEGKSVASPSTEKAPRKVSFAPGTNTTCRSPTIAYSSKSWSKEKDFISPSLLLQDSISQNSPVKLSTLGTTFQERKAPAWTPKILDWLLAVGHAAVKRFSGHSWKRRCRT